MTWRDMPPVGTWPEGMYPEPRPAHPRDTPDESALGGATLNLTDLSTPVPWEQHVKALARIKVLEQDLLVARDERDRLKQRYGNGPYVIVKLDNALDLTRTEGVVPMTIGHGGLPKEAVAHTLELALYAAKHNGMDVPQKGCTHERVE